jgi:uncharacterized protein involved in exopolysaccharide biosynthesis
MGTEQTNLSFERVLGVLRRRAGWIVLCLVLTAGAAYGFSEHQTKKYTATASLVFSNNQQAQPGSRRRAATASSPSRTRTSSWSSSATWRPRPRAGSAAG